MPDTTILKDILENKIYIDPQNVSEISVTDLKDGANYVNKISTTSDKVRVYAIATDGTPATKNISVNAYENTLAERGSGGILKVGTPLEDNDATNKQYIDNKLLDYVTLSGDENITGVKKFKNTDGKILLEKVSSGEYGPESPVAISGTIHSGKYALSSYFRVDLAQHTVILDSTTAGMSAPHCYFYVDGEYSQEDRGYFLLGTVTNPWGKLNLTKAINFNNIVKTSSQGEPDSYRSTADWIIERDQWGELAFYHRPNKYLIDLYDDGQDSCGIFVGGNSVSPHTGSPNVDLGQTNNPFNNLFLKGNLSDGTHTISIAEIAAGITPVNAVTTDTDQNITGIKTFTNGIKTGTINPTGDLIIQPTAGINLKAETWVWEHIFPATASIDVGNATYKLRDLYMSGSLKDGTNSIAISDIASKTYVDSKISVHDNGDNTIDITIN